MAAEPLPRAARASRHFRTTAWSAYATLVLGAWLVASPPTLGYASRALVVSDVASGALLLVFGALALWPRHAWARWGSSLVGLWLLFAPLLFHAPTAQSYLNDTLAGILALTFALVVPGIPYRGAPEGGGEDPVARPTGWSYNPSTWSQRLPPVLLAVVGFLAARYLAAFQLGHIQSAWDPFFGAQTERVLTSGVSQAWPVSDAGMGALGYVLDALAALVGDQRRWRTAPWIVVLFGVFVVPLGAISITLVILQPVVVGAWCTLCLLTAVVSLLMIPFAIDEVAASVQYLVLARRHGLPFWRTFWKGGPLLPGHGETGATREPQRGGGISVPWSLVATTALGAWLMAAPAVFGTTGRLADSHHVVGPLIVTFSVVALAEIARPARFVNVPLALWAIASPFVLSGAGSLATWNAVAVGVLVLALSLPRGKVKARYGPSQRLIV